MKVSKTAQTSQNIPTIFLISGPLGVGKTTLTRRLATQRKAGLINGDALFTPLKQISTLGWEKGLRITWKNILNITTQYLDNGLDVVIDFTVQDELKWFVKELKKHGTPFDLRYIVLLTDSKTLLSRLEKKKGSKQFVESALSSLTALSKDPLNKPYVCHTTGRTPSELVAICLLEKFKYKG